MSGTVGTAAISHAASNAVPDTSGPRHDAPTSLRGRLSAQSVLGSLRLRQKSLAKEAGPPSTAQWQQEVPGTEPARGQGGVPPASDWRLSERAGEAPAAASGPYVRATSGGQEGPGSAPDAELPNEPVASGAGHLPVRPRCGPACGGGPSHRPDRRRHRRRPRRRPRSGRHWSGCTRQSRTSRVR